MSMEYQLIVIGAGPGGYTAALRAAGILDPSEKA